MFTAEPPILSVADDSRNAYDPRAPEHHLNTTWEIVRMGTLLASRSPVLPLRENDSGYRLPLYTARIRRLGQVPSAQNHPLWRNERRAIGGSAVYVQYTHHFERTGPSVRATETESTAEWRRSRS
ncbi:hypothetical protein BD626DRAFT_573968 [Schizophyllum amplum]|uniref:Uncharacterized protein n=1 Tax=Schizophyllum amplum TaxID=97359 RepID=A0A550BZK4_9AGAR|nr:hypothetical protein BD626DRAFT_573968 [Auriculariopsis ampla]